MKQPQTYNNFHLDIDNDKILWLSLDRQNSSVNTLNREIFQELDAILNDLGSMNVVGLVILSAKEKGFIAGADISQFVALNNADEAYNLIRTAQLVLNRLASLTIPTVAMIRGFCLGGGLELSLACRYRIAENSSDTLIGLPEIKLGIHPGWGGTVRLPRLVGAVEAMKMILPGDAYPAKKAQKIGIIDEAVPLRELKRAARYYILNKPKPHSPKGLAALSNHKFVRPLLAKIFYQNLNAKHVNPAHYPASFTVVENWVKYGVDDDQSFDGEAKSIAKLMMTETSRNLVRVFFLQDQLKASAKGNFKPNHIHVIGAGVMGGDIAAWCAYKGFHVTLQDQTAEKIAPAIKRAYKLFEKKLREPRLIQAAMDRLQPDLKGEGVNNADLIIEAVFENLQVKHELFRNIESKLKPGALLATNTSSLPFEELVTVLKDPSSLVGIHFFNPVDKMMLVEVIKGQATAEDKVKEAMSFVGKISRLPVAVKSSPGFLVNRILMPYLLEAMQLIDEGVAPQTIDHAAVEFGMPMGPIMLADKVGLDVCLDVAEILTQHLGGNVPQRLKEKVAEKNLGIKTGKGFYTYHDGKPDTSAPWTKDNAEEYCDRLILRMLNEAVACLDEGVIENSDLLDAAMVFGIGFAPFRGGPIHYAKTRGIDKIVAQLEDFSKKYGERFKPVAGWMNLNAS